MSDAPEKKHPSHEIFVVIGDDNSRWLKIGAAFANRDGKGFNLVLDALPARDGRMVMREFTARSASTSGDKADSGKRRVAKPAAPTPTP